jgi:hypothetical protein
MLFNIHPGSGSISSPDEETINLIKYLKENIGKLQTLCQKFTNEGNSKSIDKEYLFYLFFSFSAKVM